MERAITRISHEIIEKNKGAASLALIGIKTRGIFLAQRIAKRISEIEQVDIPAYALDITPYRDDLERNADSAEKIEVEKEEMSRFAEMLSFEINNVALAQKRVVLVDDVLYTGRTVRAALNAILGFGRPSAIQLAVLIDRGHRELPIRADYVGKNVPTSTEEKIRVYVTPYDSCNEVIID